MAKFSRKKRRIAEPNVRGNKRPENLLGKYYSLKIRQAITDDGLDEMKLCMNKRLQSKRERGYDEMESTTDTIEHTYGLGGGVPN